MTRQLIKMNKLKLFVCPYLTVYITVNTSHLLTHFGCVPMDPRLDANLNQMPCEHI